MESEQYPLGGMLEPYDIQREKDLLNSEDEELFDTFEEDEEEEETEEEIEDCDHQCSGNCRRVGCNCKCGEFHKENK